MSRFLTLLAAALVALGSFGPAPAAAQGVSTQLPPQLDACFRQSLAGVFDVSRNDNQSLFNYFLANINVEQFGQYNFKRAWSQWNNDQKRLALYEYFKLMTSRRGEHSGTTTAVEASLADNPAVRGNNVYHIVARISFSGGTHTSVVVFTTGCKAFGFMYGGANLRSFVDVNAIEAAYRAGKRSPF